MARAKTAPIRQNIGLLFICFIVGCCELKPLIRKFEYKSEELKWFSSALGLQFTYTGFFGPAYNRRLRKSLPIDSL